jgi:transposase
VSREMKGLDVLSGRLHSLPTALVALDATGGYETSLAAALAATGLPLCSSASSTGVRSVISQERSAGLPKPTRLMRERVRLTARPLPEPERSRFADVVRRRRQNIEMTARERNRRQQAADKQLASDWIVMSPPGKELADIDGDLRQAIEASPLRSETEILAKSVPGIGDVTARTLPAKLPELGTVGRHQIAAFVGIAPINRDSGLTLGHRAIWGRRTSVRKIYLRKKATA